jgi:hypothetical protein
MPKVIADKPTGSGLNEWTMKCGKCGQVTTTFYDPTGDGWITGYILSAHNDCKWWEIYKKWLSRFLG